MLIKMLMMEREPLFQPCQRPNEQAANQAKSISRSAKVSALEKAAAALCAQQEIALKREHSSSDDSDSGRLKPDLLGRS
jgi:hypothetical protein